MRYGITWTQTTTYRSEISLSSEQLAAWATVTAPGVLFVSDPGAGAGPTVDQLARLIDRNHHLRDRLLGIYLEQTSPEQTPTTTHLDVVDVQILNQVDDTPS